MTLPANIGSNLNVDTNNSISSNTQLQSNQEIQSNNFEVEANQSLQDLVSQQNLVIDQDKVAIKNFISGSRLVVEQKPDIDLVFSLENNRNNILTNEILQNIKDYEFQKIESIYEGVENKASMLLSLNNNEEKYFNLFFNKVTDFNALKLKINEAVKDKTDKVITNNFETKLKNYILSPRSSSLFNLVKSYFVNNSLKNNNKKSSTILPRITDYSDSEHNLPLQFDAKNMLKNSCFLETNTSLSSTAKDIRSVINDTNLQNIVTMIRNLYFMSPNTYVGNYTEDNTLNYINLEKESLTAFTSEAEGVSFFDYINDNNNIDIKKFIESSKLNRIQDSELAYSYEINFNNTIDELQGKQHLSQSLKTYFNKVMIEDFKNVNHIKVQDVSRLGFFPPNSVLAAQEYNKIFIGKFFEVDLKSAGILKDVGTTDLLSYLLFNSSTNNSDNSVNRLFKENYLNRNNELIYRFKKPITSYISNSGNSDYKGQILSTDRFNLDDSSIFFIDDLFYKTKIDNLVKKQKLNYLINKEVDLNFAKEIIDNIKSTSLSNKMLAYCNQDKDNLSIINSSNIAFDLFFTQDEEEDKTFYSHIDIVSNHEIDDSVFKGLDKMKSLEIEENINRLNISNNIKSIIQNYYQKNNFFSSSFFLKNILKSIKSEADIIETEDFEENNLTQIIYFNYFKKGMSNNAEVKNLIAERFIKKAVQLDTVSSSSFKDSNTLNSFKYDYENIIEDDFDNSSKESMKSYVDKVLGSSEKLKKIKRSVFSSKNIDNLKVISDYKRISNIQLVNNGYSPEFETNLYAVSAVINFNLLPNYCMLYNFKSSNKFENEANVLFEIKNKNSVLENTVFGQINEETGEREVESTSYSINRQNSSFDVTKSNDILVNVTPKLCLSDDTRQNHAYPSITIKDCFDNIFSKNNYENYAFGKIIDIIQDMLRMSVKDYTSLSFNSEEEVEEITSSRTDLLEDVISLIEIFSEIYLIFAARLQRLQSLKIFNWQKKLISNSVFVNGPNNSFPLNGIISKHSNVFSNFKNVMELQSSDNISILSSEEANEYIKDLNKIVNQYEQTSAFYLQKPINDYNVSDYKTHNSYVLDNIMHSLYLSDFAQAFNFDLVNGFLNYQDKLLNSDRNEISNSEIFEEIQSVSPELVENIEENFYDSFYLNRLSKIINYVSVKNDANYKYIESCHKTFDNSLHNHKNIFKELKKSKKSMVALLGSKIKNIYQLENYTFLEENTSYLNSNFKTFALKNNKLKNKNQRSLVKIKVSIIDKLNVNRLYLPKIYLFSPMITNVDMFINDHLNNTPGLQNNKLGLFDIRSDIILKLNVQNTSDALENDFLDIKSLISSNFNRLNQNEVDVLYRYLISCHVSSFEIENILKYCYNINLKNNLYKSKISTEIFDLVDGLSNKEFFDVFNNDKTKILSKLILDEENNSYLLPNRSDVIDMDCLAYDTLVKLENLYSLSELESIKEEEYYDFYNIAINPREFYYIDNNTSILETENIVDRSNIKEIENIFEKINNLDHLNNSETVYKKSELSTDNFDIIFETEVL